MPSLEQVKNIILVLSGKGGVGKSTVAAQLAMALAHQHHAQVGLLDVDICGPSIPKICGVEGRDIISDGEGWQPVSIFTDAAQRATKDVKIMSIAFLLSSLNDAVVWRGPKKDAMIKQFLTEVRWGPLDYLIIDTPPGTSDEHLTLCEVLKPFNPAGAVIVTTPQRVATDDVQKELSFCAKLELRCLGIVENMSGFVCPHCAHCTDVFSRGGGEELAAQYEVPFLGRIPLDPLLCVAEDRGEPFAAKDGDETQTVAAVKEVISSILAQVERSRTVSA